MTNIEILYYSQMAIKQLLLTSNSANSVKMKACKHLGLFYTRRCYKFIRGRVSYQPSPSL